MRSKAACAELAILLGVHGDFTPQTASLEIDVLVLYSRRLMY
jgi:hypothetical protein